MFRLEICTKISYFSPTCALLLLGAKYDNNLECFVGPEQGKLYMKMGNKKILDNFRLTEKNSNETTLFDCLQSNSKFIAWNGSLCQTSNNSEIEYDPDFKIVQKLPELDCSETDSEPIECSQEPCFQQDFYLDPEGKI